MFKKTLKELEKETEEARNKMFEQMDVIDQLLNELLELHRGANGTHKKSTRSKDTKV